MPAMKSLPDLSELSHAQKDEVIVLLWGQVQSLTAQLAVLQRRLQELEGRLAVKQRATLSRLGVETASNSFHLSM